MKAPDTEMVTPRPSSMLPQLLCFSFSFFPISSLRSCRGDGRGMVTGEVKVKAQRAKTVQRAAFQHATPVPLKEQPPTHPPHHTPRTASSAVISAARGDAGRLPSASGAGSCAFFSLMVVASSL